MTLQKTPNKILPSIEKPTLPVKFYRTLAVLKTLTTHFSTRKRQCAKSVLLSLANNNKELFFLNEQTQMHYPSVDNHIWRALLWVRHFHITLITGSLSHDEELSLRLQRQEQNSVKYQVTQKHDKDIFQIQRQMHRKEREKETSLWFYSCTGSRHICTCTCRIPQICKTERCFDLTNIKYTTHRANKQSQTTVFSKKSILSLFPA